MANVPFVYMSVNVWRTLHPKTSVVPTLQPGMREVFWLCVAAFAVLYRLLLSLRVRLATSRRKSNGSTWSSTIDRSCRDAEENRCQAFGAVACARRAARCAAPAIAAASQQPPGQTDAAREGYVPMKDLPAAEQLPAAPLVLGAYAVSGSACSCTSGALAAARVCQPRSSRCAG